MPRLAAGSRRGSVTAARPGADKLDRLQLRAGRHPGAGEGVREIVERVSKETNGGFQIKYHLGGSLSIKVTDITTAVGDDVIQLGDDGFQQGNVPITGILRLPMLITNAQEFEKALAIMKPYVAKAYDKKGSTVLSTYYFPVQIAWSSKKLTSLEDLKGQKIRATSPEQIEFLKRFGANGLDGRRARGAVGAGARRGRRRADGQCRRRQGVEGSAEILLRDRAQLLPKPTSW